MRHAIASDGSLASVDGARGANYILLTYVHRCVQLFNVEYEFAFTNGTSKRVDVRQAAGL